MFFRTYLDKNLVADSWHNNISWHGIVWGQLAKYSKYSGYICSSNNHTYLSKILDLSQFLYSLKLMKKKLKMGFVIMPKLRFWRRLWNTYYKSVIDFILFEVPFYYCILKTFVRNRLDVSLKTSGLLLLFEDNLKLLKKNLTWYQVNFC